MTQHLVSTILFDGVIALEWEDSALPNSHDRLRIEKLLYEAYRKRSVEIRKCRARPTVKRSCMPPGHALWWMLYMTGRVSMASRAATNGSSRN